MKNIVFIESDFWLWLEWSLILRPKRAFVKSFFQRILVNISYFFRLFLFPSHTIVIAPWWLFWIPAILNLLHIKKFKIISLTCDTFLWRKTILWKSDGIMGRLKYFLAKITYRVPLYYIYCSDIVREELTYFWVPDTKLVFKYQEWCRDETRFKKFQSYVPNLSSNTILFIGHYYNMFQKRLDILIDAYIRVYKTWEFPDMKLIVVWWWWENFFWGEKIESFKKYTVSFEWYNYSIDSFIQESCFYVHPGEYEWFWVAVLEAMNAWIIPLVSNLTWASEAVELLWKNFVLPLDVESFEAGLKYLFSMKKEERELVSVKSRDIALTFNQEKSLLALDYNLKKILKDL